MGITKARCTWGREELTFFHPRLKSMSIRDRRQILLLHQLNLSELASIGPEIIRRPYVFS